MVPWNDISATNQKGWFFRYVDFRFAKQPHIRLRLSRKLAETLISAGGSAVCVRETA
jgi:hypothetical protein